MVALGAMTIAGVRAQSVAPLTLEEVTPGSVAYASHRPAVPDVCGVLTHGVLVRTSDRLTLVDPQGAERPVLTLTEWQTLSGESDANRMPSFGVLEAGGLLYRTTAEGIDFLDLKEKRFTRRYRYDRSIWRHSHIAPGADCLVLCDGERLALLEEGAEEPKVLTPEATHDLIFGMASARNEFGIGKGVFFSPTGRFFAFYRIDQSAIADYPIVRMRRPMAMVDPMKYPMAGQASQVTSVGIYDRESGTIRYLATGEPSDRYFTNLSWSPDETHLYIEEVPRSQDECRLVAYSVATGEAERTLLTERDERYVEPMHPICFTGDGKKFVRSSRRDGYRHLYLHRTSDGKLLRQLTKGSWEVSDLLGISPDDKYVYFASNKDYPMGHLTCRVDLRGKEVTPVAGEAGWHSCRLSSDFACAYDHFSSKDVPARTQVIDLTKRLPKSSLYREVPVPEDLPARPQVKLGTIKAADGVTDLYYKMTLPHKLEEGKRYPTVVYVYGGPHAQLVTDRWSDLRYNWDNYMAEQGYIVFTVDGRGSDCRGMDFESVIHRQLGQAEMADQMEGVKYLLSLPYVDPDRLGVYGWSFGGFMTTNLMLTYPETFKVGVAGGPVIDWAFYEVMYGERYMDRPQENPEGYAAARLTDRAGDLKGRLLLIHGGVDPVVVWQNSLSFLDACIAAKVHPDYMVYPGHEHNVIGPDRVHLHTVICRYFDDHLK